MKTIKVINRLVSSRDLSVSEAEVEKINTFYWKEVKNKLIALETPTIYLKEIGTLTVSKYKLYQFIKEQIRKYKNVPNLTYSDETKELYARTTLKTIQKCLKQRNILAKEEYELIQRNKTVSSQSDQKS